MQILSGFNYCCLHLKLQSPGRQDRPNFLLVKYRGPFKWEHYVKFEFLEKLRVIKGFPKKECRGCVIESIPFHFSPLETHGKKASPGFEKEPNSVVENVDVGVLNSKS